ncbi:MAG: ATP-binding protein [Syntrophomonadaceae bacterium]
MVKWRSISTKILTSYLAVVAFTFLMTALAFYPILVGVLEKRAEIGLEKQAWEIAYAIGSGIPPAEIYQLPLTIPLLGRSVESNFLWVSSLDVIVYSTDQQLFPTGRLLDRLPVSLRPDGPFDRSKANIFKSDRYLKAEVPEGSGGTVLTYVSLADLQSLYQETLYTVLGSLVIALLAAVLIAFFIIRYLIKPLRSLEDFAQAVGNRQFDQRLEVNSSNELSQLATAFNQMSDQLQSYDESIRVFFQNASHELKTPLMSINGYAEGIRDGVFTGPELDKAVEIIHKESLRLRDAVENIIDLTILDQPHHGYVLPHDLRFIVESVMDTVGGYALDKGVRTETRIPPKTLVIGDWDHLNSLLVNLVSNGIRHALSQVTVSAAPVDAGAKVRITVEDDGAGFTPSDLAHAFEYFYSRGPAGSGLGLTIAQKIVQEHNGTIRLYNAPTGGAVVEVILPAAIDLDD